MLKLLLASYTMLLSSCAYQVGYQNRQLPGEYLRVAIPVFKNRSQQVGIETVFTNELIRQFARSNVARVTRKELAPVTIEGTIESVTYTPGSFVSPSAGSKLPARTTLAGNYAVEVRIHLVLRRNSDSNVVWEQYFTGVWSYNAPRVTTEIVNSVNPLYNQSARHQNAGEIARNLMAEAHDRMTERF